MLMLDIDTAELEGLALQLDLDSRAMEKAAMAAAKRTMRWARTQIARGMASRLKAPQTIIKGRVKQSKGKKTPSLWVGLSDINAADLKASQTPGGLRASGTDFPGAFLSRSNFGSRQVALRRKGKARYPLESASVDVHAEAGPMIERESWPAMNDKFMELYAQELERRVS